MTIDLENPEFNQRLSDLTSLADIRSVLKYVVSQVDVDDLLRLTGGAKKSGSSGSDTLTGEDEGTSGAGEERLYIRAFKTRRAFCDAIGIGESTLAGWLKEKHLPPLAKAVVGLLYLYHWSVRDYELLEKEQRERSNIVVPDGDTFMIVEYKANYNRSPGTGKIEARGIPDEDTAYRYAQHIELRLWLKEYAESVEESDSALANHLQNIIGRTDEVTFVDLGGGVIRDGKNYYLPTGKPIERDGQKYHRLDKGIARCESITVDDKKYYRPTEDCVEHDGQKYYRLDY